MDRAITATRNTCFALLSAIETDVRELIADLSINSGHSEILPVDVRPLAQARFELDQSSSVTGDKQDDLDLLNYTDFGDLSKMLFSLATPVKESNGLDLRSMALRLGAMVKERNRVCHSRPLEIDDLSKFYTLSEALLSEYPTLRWRALHHSAAEASRDPRYVLRLQIPVFWRVGATDIQNNLPIPDFDETTFLGRRDERRDLRKHILGAQKVVTLVGEGGVGKSALAVQSAYDILDEEGARRFDAVVWVSLKNRVLTTKGISQLRDAVTDVLGVINQATQSLGSPTDSSANLDTLERELTEYLEHFRVLLIIDNFETFAGNPLRDFLSNVPDGSKVLITSRIGLGELELRYKLDELDENTAVQLLRRFATALNVELLAKQPAMKLARHCKLLFRNPLLIKWFVQSVAAGEDPERLASRGSQKFQEALRFCFENLFERLDPSEKAVLHLLAACRRQLTFTELNFLVHEINSVEQVEVESALSTLHNSSMLKRTAPDPRNTDTSTRLNLTDVAAEYISKFAPPEARLLEKVHAALKRLRELTESHIVQTEVYAYDIYSVRAANSDQRICAVYLTRALQETEQKNHKSARSLVERAREMLPTYSEVYRISAIVESRADNPYQAADDLETAIEYNSQSALTRYQYAQHLLRALENPAGALEQIDEALSIDKKADPLVTFRALVLTRLGRCKEAAELYEPLLAAPDRPRKWRISTADQAAECYRRWSEQDVLMKETQSYKAHIHRANQILEAAATRGDIDARTGPRLTHLLEDALFFAMREHDESYALAQLRTAADLSAAVSFAPASRLTIEVLIGSFGGTESPFAASVLELRIPSFFGSEGHRGVLLRVEATSKRLRARVKAPFVQKNYGFLTNGKDEWFFHRSSLQKPGDWSALSEGFEVEFEEQLDSDKRLRAESISLVQVMAKR